MIKFQLINDKVHLIDELEVNTEVTVSFNIRGREWEGKYIINLNAWKVKKRLQMINENAEQIFIQEETTPF